MKIKKIGGESLNFSLFWIVAMLGCYLWPLASNAGPASGTKTLNAPANPIETGQPFIYQLDARCPGSISPNDDCLDYRITDTLPANIEATALPAPGGLLEKICLGASPDRATCANIASLPTAAGATLTFFLRGGSCPNTALPTPGGRVCAGAQQSLDFSVRFAPGSTPNNTTAINSATFTSTDNSGAPTTDTPVSAPQISGTATDQATLTKTVTLAGAAGFESRYRIQACPSPAQALGYLLPTNVSVTDTLPSGATFLSATPTPDSNTNGVLSWNNLDLSAGCRNLDIRVNYPTPANAVGNTKNNQASMTYTPTGSPTPKTINGAATHNLATPNPGYGGAKTQSDPDNSGNVSQSLNYTLSCVANGNVPLKECQVIDELPPNFEFTSLSIPALPTGTTATVSYQRAANGTAACPAGVPLTGAPANTGSEYVCRIQVVWSPLDVQATARATINGSVCNASSGSGDPTPNLCPSGADVALPFAMVNTANYTALDANDNPIAPQNPSRTFTIRDPAAPASSTIAPEITKSVSPASVAPGANFTFTVNMSNSANYSSPPEQVAMLNPVFADLLPAGIALNPPISAPTDNPPAVAATGTPPGSCAQSPTVHAIPNYNGTGRIMVVFDWSGTGCSLARGNIRSFTINASIPANTLPASSLTNRGAFLGSGNPSTDQLGVDRCTKTLNADNPISSSGGPNFANGIGDPARLCQSGAVNLAIADQRSLESRKGVLGQLDADFGYGTEDFIGRTVPGGTVTWRLEIANTGNVGVRSVDIIDILPFSAADGGASGNNRGVGTNAALGTTWSPRFAKGLVPNVRLSPSGTLLSGGRVYYTNAPNPCRSSGTDPDIVNPLPGNTGSGACNPMTILADGTPLTNPTATPAPGTAGQWSTVLPANAGLINAFRVQLDPNDVIPPGQTLQLDFLMWAPFNAPTDTCAAGPAPRSPDCSQVAWNTFGFQFQYVDRGITGTAPTRVGVVVQPQPAGTASYGNYVWYDTNQNGVQDEPSSNGINDVLVEMYYDSDGNPATTGDQSKIYVQRTGPNPEPGAEQGRPGYYLFSGLPPSTGGGRYFTRFYPPDSAADGAPGSTSASTWRATQPNIGDDATDSDGAPSTQPGGSFATSNPDGSISLERRGFLDSTGVPLAADQKFRDADQGFYQATPSYSLGNRVWYDTNNDGVDNDGTSGAAGVGIANVTVELWEVDPSGNPTGGAARATTTTNATGHYLFTDLPQGNYRAVIPPTQFASGNPLNGLLSSGTVQAASGGVAETGEVGSPTGTGAVNGNSDQDANDHGVRLAAASGGIQPGSVASGVVTLGGTPAEPTNEVNSNLATGADAPNGKTDGLDDPALDDRSNLTVDFGFYSLSIGNLVWRDDGAGGGSAADGVRQTGEPGISGVTVRLLTADGTTVATTQTDADGRYLFAGLAAGRYQVEVDQGPGSPINVALLNPTTQPSTAGNPASADNDNNGVILSPAAVRSPVFALTPGGAPTGETDQNRSGGAVGAAQGPGFGSPAARENRATPSTNSHLAVDFGFTQRNSLPTLGLGAIGNHVWLDENSDGRQDPGERGIANVTVTLTGADNQGNPVNRTTATDANGAYLFTGLPAGTYQAQVNASTLPAGLTQTTANPVGAGVDFGNQNQPYAITLAAGETNLTADFGYNHNPAASVTGNTGNAALGDRVWIDADGNGRQDPGELGVSGVAINLFGDPDGNGVYDTPAGSTTTDASGNYSFTNLPPGAYAVVVDASGGPLAGYTQTGDPDHFGATGINDHRTTVPVVLSPGDVFLNVDFGYQPPAAQNNSVGDTVWFDADANGAQTAGEPGISGVSVTLYRDADGNGQLNAGDAAIATTVTDGSGAYQFAGVPDGRYLVRITDADNILGALVQSGDPDNSLDAQSAVDLDSAGTNAASVQNLAQDFGYTPRGQQPGFGLIGDVIFLDANGNGQPDAGEGIGGVTAQLLDAAGTGVLATTVSDRNGHYAFGGLDPNGSYTVRVETGALLSGVVSNTVDPDGGTPNESRVTLNSANPINLNQDFGYALAQGQTPGSIGNQIWLDRNADGVYAPDGPDGVAGTLDDETGIAGVTVDLYLDANGNRQIDPGEPRIGTTVTAASGQYLFAGLPADNVNYLVHVSDQNAVLAGYWQSIGPSAGDRATDNQSQADLHPVTLTPAAPNYPLADFGYFSDGAAVGNRVWNDPNSNGIQDATEVGIANVPVTLTITYPGGATSTVTTLTDANGFYRFGNLLLDENGSAAGNPTFSIAVATPTGFIRSPIHVGGGSQPDRNDSDDHAGVTALPVRGLVDIALLTDPNQEPAIASYDFGFVGSTASIGNRLWSDTNGNGVQDVGEPGIGGVRVFLDINGNGVFDTGEPATTTDPNGNYSFPGLPPGSYRVVVDATTLPTGATPTADVDGTGTPNVAVITLTSGQTNTEVNFGYRPPVGGPPTSSTSIGDRLWSDTNGNGAQDTGEPGIAGVRVFIDTNGNGVLDAGEPAVVTDASGGYRFTGLAPGTYRVAVDPTTLPADAAPTTDPDGVGTPNVAIVTLANGQTVSTADFGYRLPAGASITSSVWNDLNGNRARDPDETPVVGATITLTDAQGRIVGTTTTDANGNYRFTGLPPGQYTVTITLPPGLTFTTPVSYTITLTPEQVVNNSLNFGLRPLTPAEIPTLSQLASLLLLALLLLMGLSHTGQAIRSGRARR